MTRQTNNPRNTQQMDEATLRELVANIRGQLARLSDRMDVSEAREEERRRMLRQQQNSARQQQNLDLQRRRNLAEAQIRTAALNTNSHYRLQNTVALRGHRLLATATLGGGLLPLVSLSTGRAIEGFPATFDDIAQINENDARRILAALEVATDGLSTAEMRDLIRSQVHYPWMAS
ncbi:hypothetical protein J3E69DRAFT_66838 [Trichoderma sp. SZMC 28015]